MDLLKLILFSCPFSSPIYMGGLSTERCWPCQHVPCSEGALSPQCPMALLGLVMGFSFSASLGEDLNEPIGQDLKTVFVTCF